jgi:hypothetical protein
MPNEFNVGDCVASKVCPTMIGVVTDIVCCYGETGLVVKVSDREILADRNFWKKVKNNAE